MNMTTTNNSPAIDDHFSLIELDLVPTSHREVQAEPETTVVLDMVDDPASMECLQCHQHSAVDERSICQACATQQDAAPVSELAELSRDLTAISDQSGANAAVRGLGSMRGGQMRGVGFSSKDGYITAIRNGVPAHTHASYLTTLRSQYGMTTADLTALNLPGPVAASALPEGAGIVHTPTGPSIFDRPMAERQFVVGPKVEVEEAPRIQLEHGKLVAGAASQGHGVLVGWRGLGQLTRGKLGEALAKIERTDLLPAAMSAHAHAGVVLAKYNGHQFGFVVRAARKTSGSPWWARWSIARPNHTGVAGASFGDNVLVVELQKTGELTFDGDQAMAAAIQQDFQALVAAETYQAGDLTSWLSSKLQREFKAVSFGIGYYVPQKHAAAAEALCKAVSETGWGYGWVVPALPVADSDQLRDGIVRGLREEVTDLMARLTSERASAKASRSTSAVDIGPKRAQTYLKDLRAIGHRAVAYGQILGEDRVAQCRETVRLAVVDLETLLGDDYSGIGQRFSLIWEEIADDQRRAGGPL